MGVGSLDKWLEVKNGLKATAAETGRGEQCKMRFEKEGGNGKL